MSLITDTLDDREKTYGDFGQLARAIQAFKAVLRASPAWPTMTAIQREVMDMDIVKNCRIMYGNPMHMDNWCDKAGYSTLAVEEFFPRDPPTQGSDAASDHMKPAGNPATPLELEQAVKDA